MATLLVTVSQNSQFMLDRMAEPQTAKQNRRFVGARTILNLLSILPERCVEELWAAISLSQVLDFSHLHPHID